MQTILKTEDRQKIANRIFGALQHRYADSSDIDVKIVGTTVTISRGRPAVQVSVLTDPLFQVSRRKRHTFHTMRSPVAEGQLAEVVRETIDRPVNDGGALD